MIRVAKRAWLLAFLALAATAPLASAGAQSIRLHMPHPIGKAPPPPPSSVWPSTCVSVSRAALPDCRTEQRVLLQSGQLVAAVTVTVPHDTRKPTILVQAPFGLWLRGGINLRLDAGPVVKLDVQTCDQGGCYAATVMSDDFLKAMLVAKKLVVGFQGLNQQPVAVQVPLQGFADAYQRIK